MFRCLVFIFVLIPGRSIDLNTNVWLAEVLPVFVFFVYLSQEQRSHVASWEVMGFLCKK